MVVYDLHPSEKMYIEMERKLKPATRLSTLQREIHEIEDILFRSMLMAGAEIAKTHASRLLGIDEADAAQEVSMYMLESIRRYDPDYRVKGKRVKLCTYAYSRSERLLQEWILTNSRLVRIPRSKMERILIVVRAYDVLSPDQVNLPELVSGANKIMKERKGKLTTGNIFSIDEVDDLIRILLSTYIHLDQPYKRSNRANQPTIGEMLVSEKSSVVDTIEDQDKREQLFEVMQDNLTEKEFQVIMLRYFHDPGDKVPKALKEVGPLMESVYGGTNYSRESIRLLEQSAFIKLQDVEEVLELWKN
jgi:RNA polymerase sigma factor (sigma-70 family)